MSGTNDQPDAEDVVAATEFVARVLESRDLAAAGMSGRAGSLRWTCAKTLAHISDAVSWYAANLARRSTTSSEMPYLSVRTKPPFMIDCLRSAGALLAAAVRDAAADARGFHSWGRPDRSGFAAMGCDEVLIHGWDLAQGLALEFSPPEQPVERTLRRLFPWAPGRDEADPWDALLWANGRQALGERKPETKWLWHCSPLDEWNGEIRRQKPRR